MAMDQENAETHLNSWMVRWIHLGQRMAMQLQGHLHSLKVPHVGAVSVDTHFGGRGAKNSVILLFILRGSCDVRETLQISQ